LSACLMKKSSWPSLPLGLRKQGTELAPDRQALRGRSGPRVRSRPTRSNYSTWRKRHAVIPSSAAVSATWQRWWYSKQPSFRLDPGNQPASTERPQEREALRPRGMAWPKKPKPPSLPGGVSNSRRQLIEASLGQAQNRILAATHWMPADLGSHQDVTSDQGAGRPRWRSSILTNNRCCACSGATSEMLYFARHRKWESSCNHQGITESRGGVASARFRDPGNGPVGLGDLRGM